MPSNAEARPFRLLAGALMSALVVIFLAIALVMGETGGGQPPVLALAAVLVLGGMQAAMVEVAGYRLPPLSRSTAPGEATTATALHRFRDAMVLRFALSEAVAIVSIAAAFVVDSGGLLVVGLGCAISLVLLAVHVWPWRRPVERSAAALEAEGARSGLREVFGLRSDGVVREL